MDSNSKGKESPVELQKEKVQAFPKEASLEEVNVEKKATSSPTLPKVQKHKIGMMPSLEMLDDAISDEQEEKTLTFEELKLEDVEAVWLKYADSLQSDIVKRSMKSAKLHLSEEKLNITVGSSIQEMDLVKESKLMDYLRSELGVPNLQREILVDQSLKGPAPVNPVKKALTEKERYLQMRAQNPVLSILQKKFDLRPDE